MNHPPRVLVVSGEPFWQGSATGLTMSSLFREWPKDKLACIYISPIVPDWTMCNHYWKLGVSDLRFIRGLGGRSTSTRSTQPIVRKESKALSYQTILNIGSSDLRMIKQCRRHLAGQAVRDLNIYRIPDAITKDLRNFRPQIIYSMLGSNPLLQLVTDLADSFSIPIVSHFMDDWPSTLYRTSLFRMALRKMMRTRLTAVLERAPKRLVIGDAMATAFSRRYGGEFLPFMNAVEPIILEQPVVPPPSRKKIKLVYVGGLHLNRWRSLRDIGLTLQTLQAEGMEVEAVIYSQPRFIEESKKIEMPPVMHFAGSLSSDDVTDVLRDADILLHIESFDQASLEFTRYSVSSKIPESMCVARPILAYGPEELASIRYVRDEGVGVAVGVQSQEALSTALRELINSQTLRETLGAKGYHVAHRRHNAVTQRQQFRSVLEQAIYKRND